MAAVKGFHEGMVVLIDAGENVDNEQESRATPLYFSVQGRLQDVKVLVGATANALLPAYEGESLRLDAAAENGHLVLAEQHRPCHRE